MRKLLIMLIFVLLPLAVHADMGRIRTSDALVSEDSQKAIIFHNLDEEVLILGTDIKTDKPTKILRFIPFPSKPNVTLVEGDPFQRVSELMKEHEMVFLQFSKSGSTSAVPVEVAFSAQIGAHDITVICVNEITEFRNWVVGFLEGKGLVPGDDYQDVEHVASDYVKRDIKYFVFDLVEVTPEAQLVEPIAYRFKSKELYYPLKTSNTFGGYGGIDLVIISPGTLCDTGPFSQALYIPEKELYSLYPCMGSLGKKQFGLAYTLQVSTSTEISRTEAESIYSSAGNFFNKRESIFMQLFKYHGAYSFDEDILIDISQAPREAYEWNAGDFNDPFSDDSMMELKNRIEALSPVVAD